MSEESRLMFHLPSLGVLGSANCTLSASENSCSKKERVGTHVPTFSFIANSFH